MRSFRSLLGAFLILAVAATAGWWSFAGANKEDAKAAAAATSRYLVISPHTKEECLTALDGAAALGKEALARWEWGCMSGDHTGYEFVEVSGDAEALKTVPEPVRAKARAVKLSQFTAEQITAFHQMHH
jgi:hypothetical protein